MTTTWLLVANGSEAKLYETSPHVTTLRLLECLVHTESRQKGSDITSDRPGHYQGDFGGGGGASHGAFNEPTDPKEHEKERFAIELAKKINDARVHNQVHQLFIVAPAHFRGLLNKHMSKHANNMVLKSLDKDYTKVNDRDMLKTVQEHLR